MLNFGREVAFDGPQVLRVKGEEIAKVIGVVGNELTAARGIVSGALGRDLSMTGCRQAEKEEGECWC